MKGRELETHKKVYFLLLSPDNPKWLLLKEAKAAKMSHSSSVMFLSHLFLQKLSEINPQYKAECVCMRERTGV